MQSRHCWTRNAKSDAFVVLKTSQKIILLICGVKWWCEAVYGDTVSMILWFVFEQDRKKPTKNRDVFFVLEMLICRKWRKSCDCIDRTEVGDRR